MMWCMPKEHNFVPMEAIFPPGVKLSVQICSKCGQKMVRG